MLQLEALTNRPKSLTRGFLHFMQTPRYWALNGNHPIRPLQWGPYGAVSEPNR